MERTCLVRGDLTPRPRPAPRSLFPGFVSSGYNRLSNTLDRRDRMRPKAYGFIFVAVVILTLVAVALAPDVIMPFPLNPWETSRARDIEEAVFSVISNPPQRVAESIGIWINSHDAQVWPTGWPAFVAYGTRLSLISVPFWFLAGVVIFEIAQRVRWFFRRVRNDEKNTPAANAV